MKPEMKYKAGFTFYTSGSPLIPLRIDHVEPVWDNRRYHIVREGTKGTWSNMSEADMDFEAFQQPPQDVVLIIPGNIPAASMSILNGFVFDNCYMSEATGVMVSLDNFHNRVVNRARPTGVEFRKLHMAASAHHIDIFRGRNNAVGYKKGKPYLVYFRGAGETVRTDDRGVSERYLPEPKYWKDQPESVKSST